MGVERILRSQPVRGDALLAVAARLGAGGRAGDEEPGVEADLHLGGGDPSRPRHERVGVGDRNGGLFLELAHAGGGRALVAVHCPAREDPRAAHEASVRIALHEQDLGAGVRVAHHDHRRRDPRDRYSAGVELLARTGPVDLHEADPTMADRLGR